MHCKSTISVFASCPRVKVFQRRTDGSVDFFRTWSEYVKGFGRASGEFWLGNENMHSLTSIGNTVLRIDMEDFDESTRFAEYTGFSIDGLSTHYTLRFAAITDSSDAGKCHRITVCEIMRVFASM